MNKIPKIKILEFPKSANEVFNPNGVPVIKILSKKNIDKEDTSIYKIKINGYPLNEYSIFDKNSIPYINVKVKDFSTKQECIIVRLSIKGYPKNTSESFDKNSAYISNICISNYPIIYKFNKNTPLNFNILNSIYADAKNGVLVKKENPMMSNLFGLFNNATCAIIFKGNFNFSVFNINNSLDATFNYYIKKGFFSYSIIPAFDLKLKVLIKSGRVESGTYNYALLGKESLVRFNLLSNWDDIPLSYMDNMLNYEIDRSIIYINDAFISKENIWSSKQKVDAFCIKETVCI